MSTSTVTPEIEGTQPESATPQQAASNQQPAAPQTPSRLGAILGAVAKTVSTGLQGIPDKGRPSIVSGLGEGARSEQQQVNQQQNIKFRDFQSQARLTELHNQDKKLALDTQAQTDAHTKADLENRQLANSLGVDYDTLPSHGPAIIDHLAAQTAANGAASVPAGTHLSGDGETVNVPQNTQQTRDGQKQLYSMLGPAFGLPALSTNAQFVPPQLLNMLTNKIHGYGIDGKPINDAGTIGALQTQRDQLKQQGAPDPVLKTLDNALDIYKANQAATDAHAASVKKQSEQATIDAQNSPESIAGAANKAAAIERAQQPFKQAQSRFEQTLKDGDPDSAGKMLANRDIAPSQIISTRNPAFAQQAFAAAKKYDATYNPQTAEIDFKAASSPTNLGFFGSAKSLTDPGGTLDQLEEAYKKLPNGQIPKFNTLADWKSAAEGKGVVAGFAQTALGVADDYAKVLGGGQGSDTAREEILKGFAQSGSAKDIEAATDAARGAVGSQIKSRIGTNKALAAAYGDNIPQPSVYAASPGKPRLVSHDGGKTFRQALVQ